MVAEPTHSAATQPTAKKGHELLRGTLDTLILKTLTWGSLHGYGIARWLERTTQDELQIEEGSLYPALYRLERRGWVASEWGTSETGRRAKFYRLTRRGRERLVDDTEQWRRFSSAVSDVLFAEA